MPTATTLQGAAMSAPPFPRTVCGCALDRAHCQRPAYLIPGDLERIAEDLGTTATSILYLFRPGKGAIVADSRTGVTFRIPTIVPRTTDRGCVFLDSAGRCVIHHVAPFGCAYFDIHMPMAEADQRSVWGLGLVLRSVDYRDHLDALRSGGSS